MMNTTTSNNSSDDPSGNPTMVMYYYFGLSLGFLFLMTSVPFFSYYCICKNLKNRFQSRGSGSSNSNTTVVLMERRDTSVTIRQVCDHDEEEHEAIVNGYPLLLHSQVKKLHKPDSTSLIICSICLGDYKESELLRLLPHCGHFFHKECIDTWFRLKLSCPVCRNSPLPTPLAEVTPLDTRHD